MWGAACWPAQIQERPYVGAKIRRLRPGATCETAFPALWLQGLRPEARKNLALVPALEVGPLFLEEGKSGTRWPRGQGRVRWSLTGGGGFFCCKYG